MWDGGLRLAEIFLNGEKQLVVRYIQRPVFPGDELPQEAMESVLAEGVTEISFRYVSTVQEGGSGEPGDFSAAELQWQDEWEPDRPDIPLAVLLQVTWGDPGITENFFYRTAGNAAYERLGSWKQWEEEQ